MLFGLFADEEISTHAPRTGSDAYLSAIAQRSTDFNPRSPHGERLEDGFVHDVCTDFNPRSPHGERPEARRVNASSTVFQPTLPARGATLKSVCYGRIYYISTHAPRTGSDA